MSEPPLTARRRKWANERGKVKFEGKQLNYNASQQAKYQKSLLSLVRQMTRETKAQIRELYKSETAQEYIEQQRQAATDASMTSKAKKVMSALMAKFEQLFAQKAKPLAETMETGAEQVSKSTLHNSLEELTGGLSLKTGVVPKGMEEVAQAIVAENVSLIKSIPEQYFTQVTGAVMRSITQGGGSAEIMKQIRRQDGITERRARNIALDQTRKAYNSINKQRMQAVGIKKFKWIHSGGGQHPRKSHQAMSGNVYSFDDLPIINLEQVSAGYESPVRGIPGQAINCKCTMTPVIEFDEDDE